jgi:hypothetical protein
MANGTIAFDTLSDKWTDKWNSVSLWIQIML